MNFLSSPSSFFLLDFFLKTNEWHDSSINNINKYGQTHEGSENAAGSLRVKLSAFLNVIPIILLSEIVSNQEVSKITQNWRDLGRAKGPKWCTLGSQKKCVKISSLWSQKLLVRTVGRSVGRTVVRSYGRTDGRTVSWWPFFGQILMVFSCYLGVFKGGLNLRFGGVYAFNDARCARE